MGILKKLSSLLTTDPRQTSDDDQILPQAKSALCSAAELGSIEDIKKLLTNGADVNEKDTKGMTALMWAAFKGHTDIIKELLTHGADVNSKDNYEYTALRFVDLYRYKEIADLLKEAGAIE